MRKLLTLLLLGSLLAASSAFAADPIVGTWTLNVEKSKFTSGPAPKAATRVYTESAGVDTLNQKTTGADGKEVALHGAVPRGPGRRNKSRVRTVSTASTRPK